MHNESVELSDLIQSEEKTGNALFDKIINQSFNQIIHFENDKRMKKLSTIHIYTNLPSGQIDFSDLSFMTKGIQEILTNAFGYFLGKSKGNKDIIGRTKLTLINVEPGSFVIKFAPEEDITVKKTCKQLDLFKTDTDNKSEVSQTLNNILSSINSIDNEEAINSFESKFGKKAKETAKSFLISLDKKNLEFDYLTYENKKYSFTKSKIKRQVNFFTSELEKNIEKTETFKGILEGMSIRNKTLTFLTNGVFKLVKVGDLNSMRNENIKLVGNDEYTITAKKIKSNSKAEYFIESLNSKDFKKN